MVMGDKSYKKNNDINAISNHEPAENSISRTQSLADDDFDGSPSAEPSAILIVSPRSLYSQVTLENTPGSLVDDLVVNVDEPTDAAQSAINIRISRGKSRVNLSEPSRIHRRAGPPRIHKGDSSPVIVRLQNLQKVKFKEGSVEAQAAALQGNSSSNQQLIVSGTLQGACIRPGDMVLPPTLFKDVEKLRSMYDFYTPGQTAESIRDKIEQLKTRMQSMRQTLIRTRQSCIFETATTCHVSSQGGSGCAAAAAVRTMTEVTTCSKSKKSEEDESNNSGTSPPEPDPTDVQDVQVQTIGVSQNNPDERVVMDEPDNVELIGTEKIDPETGTDAQSGK